METKQKVLNWLQKQESPVFPSAAADGCRLSRPWAERALLQLTAGGEARMVKIGGFTAFEAVKEASP